MLKYLVPFLTVLFSLYGIAYAQTFNVSTTAQLRSAFENAAVNGEDDTIILEAGTYKTTDDSIGTFKFSDTEAHNLTIKAKDGLTANDVILDGANTHQALNLTNTKTATFTIDRVTINNAKSSSYGGGIFSSNSLVVISSTISGNTSSSGGGIYNSDAVTITNSTISGNTAISGGGIEGNIVTITNSTISDNTAYSSNDRSTGGGIEGNTITITNTTISGNTANSPSYNSYGGGIHGGQVTATNSTIVNNTSKTGGGGGIYSYTRIGGNAITITNTTISGNTAISTGGGIYGSQVTTTVINSTISGNTAISGGGIYCSGTFINNIFNNNSSDIYFYNFYNGSANSNVYNNYIDYTKLQNESTYTIVKKNNIQPSSGSLNFADSSFRLGAGSVAIDKGLDPNSTTFTTLFTSSTTLKTIQDALKTDKDGNTRISSAIDLGAYEYNAASTVNNCAATLSSDLKLHIPILTFNGQSYWADLQYSSGSNFSLTNAGAVTDTSSYSGCTAATLSSSYKLHIPALTYSNVSYWADFQYSATEAVFTLTGAAAN